MTTFTEIATDHVRRMTLVATHGTIQASCPLCAERWEVAAEWRATPAVLRKQVRAALLEHLTDIYTGDGPVDRRRVCSAAVRTEERYRAAALLELTAHEEPPIWFHRHEHYDEYGLRTILRLPVPGTVQGITRIREDGRPRWQADHLVGDGPAKTKRGVKLAPLVKWLDEQEA